MANNIAFQPMGPCVLVNNTSANTAGNTVTLTAVSPVQQYYIINQDLTNVAFIAISSSSNVTASIPTSSGANVVSIPPFGYQTITSIQCGPGKNAYAQLISTGTATCYITPGEGL